MWNALQPSKYGKAVDNNNIVDSSLNGLMRDVDSYISELSQENVNNMPARAQSLQQPQRQSPHMTNRSNTTHRHYKDNESPQSTYSSPMFCDYQYQPPPAGVRPALATSATFVEPGLSMPTPHPSNPQQAVNNEQSLYPSPGYNNYNHSDYVNTYLTTNARKQQETSFMNTPFNRSDPPVPSILTTDLKHISCTSSTGSYVTTAVATPISSFPPEYAFLSVLSRAFLRRVRGLENVRDLFCANEYPESFTGQEAIKMLVDLLDGIPEAYCIKLANILMKSKSPLFEPIHYSQKSIIQGALFNSPDEYYTLQEDMADEDVPTGILTSLLGCYTFRCLPGQGGCYVPKCPNKPGNFASEFNVKDHTANSSRPQSDQMPSLGEINVLTSTQPQMAWAQRVSKVLLKSLSKKEIARQEAINEMIYSEEVYKNDLDTLSEVIVTPLLYKSTIISSSKKREQFVKEVFGNYKELNEVSTALFKDLLELQHENEFVPMIGDTLIKHFAYFEDPFSQYCPRVSLAEYLVKEEERNNPDFERFIVQVEKSKRMRRLPFRHFLLNPVTRMQRYPLLISAVLKKTDKEHPDHTYLVKCLDMVKKVATQSDTLAELFKKRVQILEINDMITFKQGEFQDLQLTDPHRKLYYQGYIKRRSNGIEVTEKSDIHIFIFDHLVLMTKLRKSATATDEYRVWRRPIPLQMLHVGTSNDTSTHATYTTRNLLSNTTTGYLHGPSSYSSMGLIPLTLHHLGQRGGIYTFLCSAEEKQKWITAIDESKAALKKRLGENVYDVITLDDTSFRSVATPNSATKQGRVNCTVPFITMHNEHKIAVGTDTGIYFKSIDRVGIRKVLSCENVTQLALLEKYHILLVLADKTLKAYPLDMLDSPTTAKGKLPERLGQELGQHVHFFQVGFCNNKDLLIFKKKKNTMSIFTCLEPIYDLRDPKNQKYITQKTGFMMTSRSSHSWFKKYKEFYVGAEASNIHFLKSKLLIVCERGFEIIDPENLSVGGRDIPDKGDPQFNFVHRQGESIKPLAMYRVHDKFLLCYNKFAFYVNNRNGSLVQRGPQKLSLLCEWEGNPENIVFQYPYVIAFDPQFIEIHHVDTGNLVQIIPGDQIRLTYFQTIGDKTVIQGCMTHSQRSEIQNIFYLKLNHLRNNSARKFI